MLKLRRIASQLCASFPFICLELSHGALSGYVVIIVAELNRKDSEIPVSLDQLSWYASLQILRTPGSITTGLLAQRFGSRLLGLIASLIYITSYILYYNSTTATTILISGSMAMIPSISSMSGPHVSEISEYEFRSSFLAILHVAYACGAFSSLLLGSLVHWQTIALVNLSFGLVAAITSLFIPNSPIWLASKGRLIEAKKALSWLRGWVQPVDVQTEFRLLVDSSQEKSKSFDHTTSRQKRLTSFFQQFLHRSFYLPLAITSLVFILMDWSGFVVFNNYMSVVYEEIKSPVSQSTAPAITGVMTIIAQLLILLLIGSVGKRLIACFSSFVIALCFIAMFIGGFVGLQGDYLWIPTIGMIVGSFTVNGIDTTAVMLCVNALTMHGTFLLFAIINIIALFTYYFVYPETEGKSLKEIEDRFRAVKKSEEVNESYNQLN